MSDWGTRTNHYHVVEGSRHGSNRGEVESFSLRNRKGVESKWLSGQFPGCFPEGMDFNRTSKQELNGAQEAFNGSSRAWDLAPLKVHFIRCD
jgi:hypothetical protein